MKCKKGDMALVIKDDERSKALGAIVKVEEFVGSPSILFFGPRDFWRVRTASGCPVEINGVRTEEFLASDSILLPLPGLPEDDTSEARIPASFRGVPFEVTA